MKYQSKTKFEADDYYNQVKFLPESSLEPLREKIIASCDYLPKPAELKRISKDLGFQPVKKKEHPDINFDNCITVKCNQPVYKSLSNPYYCKKCSEMLDTRTKKATSDLKQLGYPVGQTSSGSDKPLKKLLERVQRGIKERQAFL